MGDGGGTVQDEDEEATARVGAGDDKVWPALEAVGVGCRHGQKGNPEQPDNGGKRAGAGGVVAGERRPNREEEELFLLRWRRRNLSEGEGGGLDLAGDASVRAPGGGTWETKGGRCVSRAFIRCV
jgi:hypothetical protein